MTAHALGKGIYSVAEASLYTGVPYQRLYAWFGAGRLFKSDYHGTDLRKSISFLDLVDALVASEFRKRGVSMQYVRRAYESLKSDLQTSHPFCHKHFFTGSGEIYLKVNDKLSEVLSRQVFDEAVLRGHLSAIEYDAETLLARRWNIRNTITLDPMVVFGKPCLDSTRVPTSVLASSYYANGKDAPFVAGLYELTPRDVLTAVSFESEIGRMPSAA